LPKVRSTPEPPASVPRQDAAATPGVETDRDSLDGAPTTGGGLLFVIPLLQAAGFAAWLAERPALAAARLPERLLLLLAAHAGLPPDDPIVEWLAATARDAPTAEGAEDACRMWRAGLRGWLARRARLTLRELIVRPALFAVTPTHVDLTFDLAQADLRIRRLGLDVDPGWVAWLGRVVSFHYDDKVTR
jgi:hypothetical protein